MNFGRFDWANFPGHLFTRMRALQNCARRFQRQQNQLQTDETASRHKRAFVLDLPSAGGAYRFFLTHMRSKHVAVTGKVKFFNETKGYSYADLISDLAALG
jgi:hypothetical protein